MTTMKDDAPMGPMTTADALATALDGMVSSRPVADVLARLMQDCLLVLPADAAAVLVLDGEGGLELLSASSHRAEEIELLQIQRSEGPCVQVIQDNRMLEASGTELAERWGEVGVAIGKAGFQQVRAYPMRWHGQAIGGLNILSRAPRVDDDTVLGQVLADLATLVVVHAADVSVERVLARVREAVSARATIEQAKGVLAVTMDLEPDAAYDVLLQRARESELGLTAVAARLVDEAYER
jgi:hypothetical protein